MLDFETIARAYAFAAKAHGDQMRKYVLRPYIEHPVCVSMMVSQVPGATTEMVVAALLHDVVEDTPYTHEAIKRNFGEKVARIVWYLTDVSRPEDGNRAARKKIDAHHTASARDWEVHTVKVADLIDNTRSIAEHDPDFWVVYRKEKAYLLDLLTEADSSLRDRAFEQIVYSD